MKVSFIEKIVGVALGIIVILLVVSYIGARYLVSRLDGTGGVVATSTMSEQYSSEDGYTFNYPNSYILSSQTLGTPERQWDVLVLMNQNDLPVGQNTEGPPNISVGVYPNPEGLSLKQWVMSDARSNWKMIIDERASTSTTVAGLPAIWYHYTGLYENDAVAVAKNGKVFVFTVGYLAPTDQIRADFNNLLYTVQFDI